MTQPTSEGPQDVAPGQPWPAWPPSPDASPSGPPEHPGGASAPAPLAGPRGPNWVLAVVGLLLLLVAGGQLAYLLGFRPSGDVEVGPRGLIATGAVLLLVGVVGLVARRAGAANRRRRRATRCR